MVYVRIYCNGVKIRSYGNSKRSVYGLLTNYTSTDNPEKTFKFLINQIPQKIVTINRAMYSAPYIYRFSYEIIKVSRHNKSKKIIDKKDIDLMIVSERITSYYITKLIYKETETLHTCISYPTGSFGSFAIDIDSINYFIQNACYKI